ncbi:CoA ester lyase [Microbacterium sp. Kw_RZR3]|uniref:HpcH/HpaI aldolase/citrate lyase family protein n=1 Tax=Microbacterium sp. Kw_RZR3 TaxID=3032903 RepID=UPI0023DC37E6|nr:CoA ester lyase [Microbacterium sp. Kw_RZR3]MDF2045900.1 CoA ester lyase [Microbacterium sp. Kw_RZR3]
MHGPALLFCPADRADRYAKAAAAADTVILDLEDAVAPADKVRAREALAASTLDPERVIVRMNPAGTPEHALDLLAVRETAYTTVMLAKAESAADVEATDGFEVVALCETARGIVHAAEIAAHPATVGLMWGAEDLIASMNGRSSRFADGRYRDVARTARANVLLAARAHGKDAIDAVHLDIADLEGLRAECEDAAASGFTATACIHPTQVETIRAAYASTDAEREWARAVLAEAEGQPGVFRFRGRMIDEPVLRQAREMLR